MTPDRGSRCTMGFKSPKIMRLPSSGQVFGSMGMPARQPEPGRRPFTLTGCAAQRPAFDLHQRQPDCSVTVGQEPGERLGDKTGATGDLARMMEHMQALLGKIR